MDTHSGKSIFWIFDFLQIRQKKKKKKRKYGKNAIQNKMTNAKCINSYFIVFLANFSLSLSIRMIVPTEWWLWKKADGLYSTEHQLRCIMEYMQFAKGKNQPTHFSTSCKIMHTSGWAKYGNITPKTYGIMQNAINSGGITFLIILVRLNTLYCAALLEQY